MWTQINLFFRKRLLQTFAHQREIIEKTYKI